MIVRAGLSALLLAFATATSAPPRLAVRVVRFYRATERQTGVVAVLQVPQAFAEASAGRIAWQTTVTIRDGSGLELLREQWWSGASAAPHRDEALDLQPLRLPAMNPGRYRLTVAIRDSVSGRSAETATEIVAFENSPLLSDLLLASSMRRAPSGDTVLNPGEMARGDLRFTTTPDLTLDGANPVIAFLMEAYTEREGTAATVIEIRDGAGKSIYKLPAFTQQIPAGGGVIRGQLPLEGLGEGEYQFLAQVTLNGQTVARSGTFAVGALEAALARGIAARSAAQGLDEAYFGGMTEEELDQAAEVLQLIATPKQLSVYKKDGPQKLTLSAKRAFLTQFWAERDQTKATPENETRQAFYEAVAYVNATFGEAGRAGRPGWKTDRGRVWARNGPPDDKLARQQEGRAPSYEVWRYTRGRMRYYIFADRTNLQQFALMKTNDLKENGVAGWIDIMTPEAVRDLGQYLGQNFFETSPGSTIGSNP